MAEDTKNEQPKKDETQEVNKDPVTPVMPEGEKAEVSAEDQALLDADVSDKPVTPEKADKKPSEAPVEPKKDEVALSREEELTSFTLEKLKGVAIGFGMAPDKADKFTTKDPLVTTILLLEQAKMPVARGVEVSGEVNVPLADPALRDRKVVDADGNVVVKKAIKDNPIEDRKQFKSRKATIKAHLDSQEKVPVFIPRDFGEKAGAIMSVTINAYRYSILKGVMVEVPLGVYEILKDSLEATDKAGQEFLADRVKFDETIGQNVSVGSRL